MSIWNISEPVADFLFNLSNAVLILGAFLVFTGTIGSIWMQAAKSYFSDERIAANEAATARAKADAEIAAQKGAEANERAAELKLALEREIAARQPRHITQQQRDKLVAKLAKISGKGEISITAKLFDEEAIGFAKELLSAFMESGFDANDVRGPMGFGVSGQWILVRDLKRCQTIPSWVGEVQVILKDALGLEFDGREMDASFKADVGDVLIAIGAKLPR